MKDLSVLEPMASEQGWNTEICLLLLVGFIEKAGITAAMTDYLRTVQAEENAEWEEALESDSL